ncbi:hypothetical protein ACFL2F_03885 [Myxococcota bacterium]
MKPAILFLLVLSLLLPSCKSKRDKCVSVVRLMKAEAQATDAVVKKKADAPTKAEHTKLIEATIAELREMQFKEKKLVSALKSYIGALGALGELKPGAEDLAPTLTYLESSRRRVADECNR